MKVKAKTIGAVLALVVAVAGGLFFVGKGGHGGGDPAKADADAKADAGKDKADAGKDRADAKDKSPDKASPAETADAKDKGPDKDKAPDKDRIPILKADLPPRPPGAPFYSIELASFRDLDRARQYAGEMQARNLAPRLVETMDAAGLLWYHVRVGVFTDADQAGARLWDVDRAAGLAGIVTAEVPAPDAPATGGGNR